VSCLIYAPVIVGFFSVHTFSPQESRGSPTRSGVNSDQRSAHGVDAPIEGVTYEAEANRDQSNADGCHEHCGGGVRRRVGAR